MFRSRRVAALAIAAVGALALGTAWAHASANTARSGSSQIRNAPDTDDLYKPNATVFLANSTSAQFTVPATGGITVTCNNSTTAGKTKGPGLAGLPVLPPSFDDGIDPNTGQPRPCHDNQGQTDTTTTSSGWSFSEKDIPNDEAASEPNADHLLIVIPKAGAVVVNPALGCTITVSPNGPFVVSGLYNDNGTATFNISNLPISVAGPSPPCPAVTTAKFVATYTIGPPFSDGS